MAWNRAEIARLARSARDAVEHRTPTPPPPPPPLRQDARPSGGSAQGRQIAGRFTLGEVVGAGAMGVVHRAYDQRAGRGVAVKLLKTASVEGMQRFEREAVVLSRLAVPEVAAYYSHGTSETGQAFLAMEWLEGESLKARGARARLSFGETVSIGVSVARALAAAHALGVVHRDVKPANVMIVGRVDPGRPTPGSVKVVDFGVAHFRGAGETLTETGAMIGTPAFMSPEQATGSKDLDGRSDLFSLGALLFWCLTGRPPFADDDGISLLLRLTQDRAPLIGRVVPDTPPALARLIDALLEPQPSARPRGAAEVAHELASIGARLGDLATVVPSVLELERTVARSGSMPVTGATTSRASRPTHLYWMLPVAVGVSAAIAVAVTLALRPPEQDPRGKRSAAPLASPPHVASVAPVDSAAPPPSASPTEPPKAGPLFLYADPAKSFEASFECAKPSVQSWPEELYQGMKIVREISTCNTKLGYASVSRTDTLSGNMMECDMSFRVGEPMLLGLNDCTADPPESFMHGKFVAQREIIRCKKTKMTGEMRMYCDPARVVKGQGRFFVVWYMRFENLWSAPDAARFFESFRLID